MMFGFHVEVVLVVSYAIFLASIACVLELLARHSHQRSERYRNSGFIYFAGMDHWECPAGRQLVRIETDHRCRIVHYRAHAEACNSCPLKNNCTDSEEGRRLERRMDSWVESELRRFHRGISLTLLFLAILILVVETARHPERRELFVMGVLLIPLTLAETTLFRSFLTERNS